MSDAFILKGDPAPLHAPAPGRHGTKDGTAGLTLTPVDGRAVVLIQPFDAEATARILAAEGLSWPATGMTTIGGAGVIAWAGLDKAFAIAAQSKPGELAARLEAALGARAAVTDQGDGRVIVRLAGPALTSTLRKLVAIDVDPSVFTPGLTAITQMAHVGVQLIAEAEGAVMVIMPRTFAGSVLHEIVEAGAFDGVEVAAA